MMTVRANVLQGTDYISLPLSLPLRLLRICHRHTCSSRCGSGNPVLASQAPWDVGGVWPYPYRVTKSTYYHNSTSGSGPLGGVSLLSGAESGRDLWHSPAVALPRLAHQPLINPLGYQRLVYTCILYTYTYIYILHTTCPAKSAV